MSIEEQVKRIISEHLDVSGESLTASTTFKELGADSLDLAELVIAFERTFKIQILPETASRLRTVDNVIEYVRSKAPAAARGGETP